MTWIHELDKLPVSLEKVDNEVHIQHVKWLPPVSPDARTGRGEESMIGYLVEAANRSYYCSLLCTSVLRTRVVR